MLDQIILRRAILTHICQQLADYIELMIPRKYDIFRLFRFPCQLVLAFLGFNEDELADEVEDSVLFQNVLPHIGDAVFVLEGGVTRTGIDAFAVAHVEGQEEGRVPGKLGGHIDLLQIHCKVNKAPGFEPKQPGLRITVNTVLIDSVLIGLTCGITFQFKGHDGNAVQENDQVNPLIIACPDFLHNGENVFLILRQQLLVKGSRRFRVHQFQLHVGNLDAVFQNIQQAATGLCGFSIDKADESILKVSFVDFAERRHFIGLGVVQKLKQQLPVHSKETVIACRLADNVTVVLRKPVHDEMLIFFFGQNIIHFHPPCIHFPVAKSINASNLIFPSKSDPYSRV